MATRRTPAPPRPTEAVPPTLRPTLRAKPLARAAPVTADARHAMIAESAYLRAERRGFTPGNETEDWLAAEAEVDALLKLTHGGSPQ
ncbi:MAG: DUF2934 domain-containing protein [Proteobacteria bacterium]|nr:DUF2934 domain-containing protein [Pseudomonadota bacterium]